MAAVNLKLPDITMEDLEDDVKLQKILSYLYQLNEQLRYELTHIDDDNISKEGVSAEALAGTINRTITSDQGEVLQLYASARRMIIQLTEKVGELPTKEDVGDAIAGQEEFITTTVEVRAAGVKIKTGGTFEVESEKFGINADGEMSAVNARIAGQLSVDGNDVWHKGNIVVSTVAPEEPEEGTLWVQPDMSTIPATGTWKHDAFSSRPWEDPHDLVLSGANIGEAPSNATYTYTVKVPIFHTFNDEETYTCIVYLGASEGAKTINMGAQTFTDGGEHTYKATVTSDVWLGNAKKIYMRVDFSGYKKMTVNSHSPISCSLTAKSTSEAGWKACTVQMYAG